MTEPTRLPPPPEDVRRMHDARALAEAGALPRLTYERDRVEIAKGLGIRPRVLDETMRRIWDNLAELRHEIVGGEAQSMTGAEIALSGGGLAYIVEAKSTPIRTRAVVVLADGSGESSVVTLAVPRETSDGKGIPPSIRRGERPPGWSA